MKPRLRIVCLDPDIKLLLQFLVTNPATAQWFKNTSDLVKDFDTNIKLQFPKLRLL